MSFVSELKRRNVVRVALAYMAGAWLLVQIADTMIEAFLWPQAWLGYVIIAFAIGFIPAVIIAWAFELTPQGIVRDDGGDTVAANVSGTRRFDRLVMAALAIAVAYFVIDEVFIEREVLDRSIAVLPFDNLSGDPGQEYFADGVAGEILQILSEAGEIKVTSWSSSEQYRGATDVPEVGDDLDVSYVVEGSVQKAGNAIRVTARLLDAEANEVIWSDDWDRELTDVFAIQDEVARKVARKLRVELIKRHRNARDTDTETYERSRYFACNFILNREHIGQFPVPIV